MSPAPLSPQYERMLVRAILDNPQVSVISAGPDGIIKTFNRGAENLLQYKADEVIGKTPEMWHDSAEVVSYSEQLTKEFGVKIQPGLQTFTSKATITGEPDLREWTYVRKDGSRIRVVLEVEILRDDNGAMQGYVGVSMQVSERRAASR